MGRKGRERRERIEAGLEESIASQMAKARPVLENSFGRKAVVAMTHGEVVRQLSQGDVGQQIETLNASVPVSKLKDAIMSKAPGEMDKGIRKLQKEGKPVTVDALCAEVKSTPGFLAMCQRAGLNLEWFEALARKRMEVLKV